MFSRVYRPAPMPIQQQFVVSSSHEIHSFGADAANQVFNALRAQDALNKPITVGAENLNDYTNISVSKAESSNLRSTRLRSDHVDCRFAQAVIWLRHTPRTEQTTLTACSLETIAIEQSTLGLCRTQEHF